MERKKLNTKDKKGYKTNKCLQVLCDGCGAGDDSLDFYTWQCD